MSHRSIGYADPLGLDAGGVWSCWYLPCLDRMPEGRWCSGGAEGEGEPHAEARFRWQEVPHRPRAPLKLKTQWDIDSANQRFTTPLKNLKIFNRHPPVIHCLCRITRITQPSKGLVMSCGKKKDGGGKKR